MVASRPQMLKSGRKFVDFWGRLDEKMKLHGRKPVVSSPLASAELKSAEAEDFRIHPRR